MFVTAVRCGHWIADRSHARVKIGDYARADRFEGRAIAASEGCPPSVAVVSFAYDGFCRTSRFAIGLLPMNRFSGFVQSQGKIPWKVA